MALVSCREFEKISSIVNHEGYIFGQQTGIMASIRLCGQFDMHLF